LFWVKNANYLAKIFLKIMKSVTGRFCKKDKI
jgi:hypothetical protein